MIERTAAYPIYPTSRAMSTNQIISNEMPETQKISYDSSEKRNQEELLMNMVQEMNESFMPTQTSLKFELHEKLHDYYVKIIDDTTKEVIREIPSKKMLDMYAAMREFMGLAIDEKI
ncbi:hypothetical protein NCCP28_27870 [Niallia sp. NCCP-28]|nr:hypothetical protein NCCP28_27870 [Niallia sp. NCCP-28]